MTHIEYIEKQLNIIRFAGDKWLEIVKLLGCLEYFLEAGLINREELNFFMRRADTFMTAYPKNTEGAELPPN